MNQRLLNILKEVIPNAEDLLLPEEDSTVAAANAWISGRRYCQVTTPQELLDQPRETPLYGFLRMDTGYHVILGWGDEIPHPDLGAGWIGAVCASRAAEEAALAKSREMALPACVIGRLEDEKITFFLCRGEDEKQLETNPYRMIVDMNSRQSALLETDWMGEKTVIIVGLGSLGIQVAAAMVRSGVGHLVLMDADPYEIHNNCRHLLTLADLGRYKVDAAAELIHRINPKADVRVFRRNIQDVPVGEYEDLLRKGKCVVVGCCDNRTGDAAASDVALAAGVPFISMGLWDRAWGGELFVNLPVRGDVPYREIFRKYIEAEADTARRSHLYLDENKQKNAVIVPGLYVDVAFAASILCKVILDVLNVGQKDYKARLLYHMQQLNWFCGTADRSAGKEWESIMPDPLSFRPIALPEAMRAKYASEAS